MKHLFLASVRLRLVLFSLCLNFLAIVLQGSRYSCLIQMDAIQVKSKLPNQYKRALYKTGQCQWKGLKLKINVENIQKFPKITKNPRKVKKAFNIFKFFKNQQNTSKNFKKLPKKIRSLGLRHQQPQRTPSSTTRLSFRFLHFLMKQVFVLMKIDEGQNPGFP